jgi:hypothetical protein
VWTGLVKNNALNTISLILRQRLAPVSAMPKFTATSSRLAFL